MALILADLIGFPRPYDLVYVAANWQHCVRDVDFERRMSTEGRGVLAGW